MTTRRMRRRIAKRRTAKKAADAARAAAAVDGTNPFGYAPEVWAKWSEEMRQAGYADFTKAILRDAP